MGKNGKNGFIPCEKEKKIIFLSRESRFPENKDVFFDKLSEIPPIFGSENLQFCELPMNGQ